MNSCTNIAKDTTLVHLRASARSVSPNQRLLLQAPSEAVSGSAALTLLSPRQVSRVRSMQGSAPRKGVFERRFRVRRGLIELRLCLNRRIQSGSRDLLPLNFGGTYKRKDAEQPPLDVRAHSRQHSIPMT